MVKAIWKDIVLAESDNCVFLDGVYYFPPQDVRMDFLKRSESYSRSPQKGEARFYDVKVGSDVNRDAAWQYLDPKPRFSQIKGYVAFWKGIKIQEE